MTYAASCLSFHAVADKANWKNPIDAVVDLFEPLTGTTTGGIGRYRVKAVGYYNAVGA